MMQARVLKLGRWAFLIGCFQLATGATALACGPLFDYPRFWFVRQPAVLHESFLGGDLGILDPSFSPAYLYVAYRHLSGIGLEGESREAVASFWPQSASEPRVMPASIWRRARAAVGGAGDVPRIEAYRLVERKADGYVYHGAYWNCLDDAFETAAGVLEDRIERFGEDSAAVRRWVAAQDEVFSNCRGGRSIPEPLGIDASPLERADRAYQIAAAHFYSEEYRQAERLFSEIAADGSSPWSTLAAYLVARCRIRAASVGGEPRRESFTAAAAVLDRLLADTSKEEIHEAARGLRQYLRIRLDPETARRDLVESLTASPLVRPLRQGLLDYFYLLDHLTEEKAPEEDLADWLGRRLPELEDLSQWLVVLRWRGHEPVRRFAFERWRETESPAWLVVALNAVFASDPWLDRLMQESALVEPSSDLYPSLAYRRASLLSRRGEIVKARRELDRLLERASGRLAPGDLNRVYGLRAQVAASLEEFVKFAQVSPVAITHDYESGWERPIHAVPNGLSELRHRKLFDRISGRRLNRELPLSRLVEILSLEELDPKLRKAIALATWTRAVLLQEEKTALGLAPLVEELSPGLGPELEAYMVAESGRARRFSAALTLLRNPGLHPAIPEGFGRREPLERRASFLQNWWCGGSAILPSSVQRRSGFPKAAFLSPEEQSEARAQRTRLEQIRDAPVDLGYAVLSWAEAHPEDSRVAEALHRVVQATRYSSCRSEANGEISRAAFQTLHRRYPKTSWAKKTKYWYE
jgi:hypothetical protein